MRLLITTSDRWAPSVGQTLTLLDRYWPEHPIAEVLFHTTPPPKHPTAVNITYGSSRAAPWSGALYRHLRDMPTDETVLLMLGDYGLCQPARTDLIARAEQVLRDNEDVGLVYLTWFPAGRNPERRDDVLLLPPRSYVKLAPALWRRSYLYRSVVYSAACDPLAFEARSRGILWPMRAARFAELPEPADGNSHVNDVPDKTGWPIAYNNLWREGQPNPQHARFLVEHGLEWPPPQPALLPPWQPPEDYDPHVGWQLDSAGSAGCGCAK